ncbi:MAG: hypothetical protein HOQ32_04580 [Lysobacter sp.]|nr:hypothetical protein [Lysobacter sp.]
MSRAPSLAIRRIGHLPIAMWLLVSAGCGTTPVAIDRDDDVLQWRAQSAELFFYDAAGKPLTPFDSNMVSVPGYLFTKDGGVKLHAGEHWIGFRCPLPEGVLAISHWFPKVKYRFVAGRAYELHCDGSQPVIRERVPKNPVLEQD